MKIAFLILVHNSPEKVFNFIQRTLSNNIYYYIHVDKKSDINIFIKKLETLKANVCFSDERYDIKWGGISMVKATLWLMKLAYLDWCDRYIVKSWEDVSLVCGIELTEFFETNKNLNYVEYSEVDPKRILGYNLMEQFPGKSLINRLIRKIIQEISFIWFRRKPAVYNVDNYYKWSNWICINKEAVKYIFNFLDKNKNFLDFHKFVGNPDESFFQTILCNSELKKQIINDDLTYKRWIWNLSPEYLTNEEILKINTNKYLFARKV